MPLTATAPDQYAAPRHSAAGLAWRWLTVLAIVAAIAVNAWSVLHPFGGQSQAVVSAKYPTLLTPAGQAFSIWGLIFLSLLLYAGWHMRGTHDEAAKAKELREQMAALEDARLDAQKYNLALIAELRKPKAGVEIREIVRNNPSLCVLPKPIFDGLLHAIREGNAAR